MHANDLTEKTTGGSVNGADLVDPECAETGATTPRRRRRLGERGASLVEYGLLIALIAVVCIGAVTQFGGNNETGINRAADSIVTAGLP